MPAVWRASDAAGARQAAVPKRVLIAGVGYRNLRDMSLGPVLLETLGREQWPAGVEIEDLSYGPVGVMHNLDSRTPYDRIVFVAGARRGRRPGEVTVYRWRGELPDPEEIQARVAEAVTGVVSLDNLLVIATYFRKLPADVAVIEVEAQDDGWGEGFTPPVEKAIPRVVEEIKRLVIALVPSSWTPLTPALSQGERGVPYPSPHPSPEGTEGERTLVVGFGNVLLSDDGFGVRVLQRLSSADLPSSVVLLDAGTGGMNLLLSLMEGFSKLIVVDAVRRGEKPGTLSVFAPKEVHLPPGAAGSIDPHFAEPARAVELARELRFLPERVTVVGCEPANCELGMELTPAVEQAVGGAVERIRELVFEGV